MTIQPAGKTSGQSALTGLTVQDQRRIQDALDSSTLYIHRTFQRLIISLTESGGRYDFPPP